MTGTKFFINALESIILSQIIWKTNNAGYIQYCRGRVGKGIQPPPPHPPSKLSKTYQWTDGPTVRYIVASPWIKKVKESESPCINLPLMSCHHLVNRSFPITTYHVSSTTITRHFHPFFHFCHFIWSAAVRDTFLSLDFDNDKVRHDHLSQHPSFKSASERVSLLFCSFGKKMF